MDQFFGKSTNAFTFNCSLSRRGNERICAVDFDQYNSEGATLRIRINGAAVNINRDINWQVYKIRHNWFEGVWRLVRNDRVICTARKPYPWSNTIFVEHMDENGRGIRSIRMESRWVSHGDFQFYEGNNTVPFMYMQRTHMNSVLRKECNTQVDNILLAFLYAMATLMFRRGLHMSTSQGYEDI